MKRLFCLLIGLSFAVQADEIQDLANALYKIVPKKKEAVFTEGVMYQFTKGGPKNVRVYIKRGNMSAQGAEVVVDAANKNINPGGGVSGYLFKWAKNRTGVTKNEWMSGKPSGFKAGDAWLNTHQKVRIAYNHDTKIESDLSDTGSGVNEMQIIHAVGPYCGDLNRSMKQEEKKDQYNAYKNSLKAADNAQLTSIVLPFLSADIFACKNDDASQAAINGLFNYLVKNKDSTTLQEVHLVLLQPGKKTAEEAKYRHFLKAIDNWSKKNKNFELKKTVLTPNP